MDILIVDDNVDIALGLSQLLDLLDCKGKYCHTPEDAETLINFHTFDLAILDYNLSKGLTGIGLMVKLKRKNPKMHVIIMTADASIELAVDAMKQGAFDFIKKPFDIARLERSIESIKIIQAKEVESPNLGVVGEPCINVYAHEKELIVRALAESDTFQEAADRLGIDKVTLWRKRKMLGLLDKKTG